MPAPDAFVFRAHLPCSEFPSVPPAAERTDSWAVWDKGLPKVTVSHSLLLASRDAAGEPDAHGRIAGGIPFRTPLWSSLSDATRNATVHYGPLQKAPACSAVTATPGKPKARVRASALLLVCLTSGRGEPKSPSLSWLVRWLWAVLPHPIPVLPRAPGWEHVTALPLPPFPQLQRGGNASALAGELWGSSVCHLVITPCTGSEGALRTVTSSSPQKSHNKSSVVVSGALAVSLCWQAHRHNGSYGPLLRGLYGVLHASNVPPTPLPGCWPNRGKPSGDCCGAGGR